MFGTYTSQDIYDNKWRQITWVNQNVTNHSTDLFIDGQPVAWTGNGLHGSSGHPSSFPHNWGRSFVIGAENNRGTVESFSNAEIDDVRIYDRALSAPEVMSLYHLESAGTCENNQNHTDQNATAPVTGDPAPSLFHPYPRTLAREELKDGKFRFWGQILADGGSPTAKSHSNWRTICSSATPPCIPHPFSRAVRTSIWNSNSNPASATTTGRWPPAGVGHDGRINQEAHHLGRRNPLVVRHRPDAGGWRTSPWFEPSAGTKAQSGFTMPNSVGPTRTPTVRVACGSGSRITIGPGLNRRLIPTCGITISADGST